MKATCDKCQQQFEVETAAGHWDLRYDGAGGIDGATCGVCGDLEHEGLRNKALVDVALEMFADLTPEQRVLAFSALTSHWCQHCGKAAHKEGPCPKD